MVEQVRISHLMETSGVKFGTSGARGLVTDMTDRVCYAYTTGFLQQMEAIGDLEQGSGSVAIAGDLRASSDRIMAAAAKAVVDKGYQVVNCGKVPSPAVALYGLAHRIPAVMVTGSHIPDDRNGIKYNKVAGEVLKDDEAAMKEQVVTLPDIFNTEGNLKKPFPMPPVDQRAGRDYVSRYLDAFPTDCLKGLKIGLYEHSSVGRDLMYDIFTGLGAGVTRLGRTEKFIPVDTEAIRPEDVTLAEDWSKEHGFDAIVSTDGDSDRPLLSDEHGKWLRGDVAGVLAAQFLEADAVATPVSCNSVVEKTGSFKTVSRTRIGSPYVIAQMLAHVDGGFEAVVGYEANGGFLTASPIVVKDGQTLSPLPTRDPVIVQLAILVAAKRAGQTVSELLAALPARFTASDRLKEFPREKSLAKIDALKAGGSHEIAKTFPGLGAVAQIDDTDGLRITFDNDEVVHLRPSGNAPELRCYTEAATEERAIELGEQVIELMSAWR